MDEISRDVESWVKNKTKKIPLVDRWTVTSRVAIVAVGVIPPVVFIVFWIAMAIWATLHNRSVDQKYAALNARSAGDKKNN